MKKLLFALLIALFGTASLFACEECRKKELAAKQGVLFTGWKLAPLQFGLGIDGWRGLADKDCDTVFTFGLFLMEQDSAVLSLCTISELKNNYGIQLSPFIADAGVNYGLSLGLVTASGINENYGLRIGILNISGKVEEIQFVGVNCFDLLFLALVNQGDHPCQIGLANFESERFNRKGGFQFGLFNRGDNVAFQLGLLNYNRRSYIPWMPLVNFPMKPKEEERRSSIPVSVTKSGEKEKTVYLPAR